MVKTHRSRSRTILLTLAAATAVTGISSCGGGGGTGASPATGLAFSVTWEQAPAAGASSSSSEPALFASPIPPSVGAIRFLLRPSLGGDCCIAVVRGSEAFTNRHIQLANVQPGDGSLEVNGYPENFAPNEGALPICATRIAGEGEPCEPSSRPPLPSFGSDEIAIDVVPGVTNVVNVDVHSLPFLLDLTPDEGETVDGTRPHVNFTVVDAVHDIDPDIDILISDNDVNVQSEILKMTECVDNSPDFPDCSGGELDVRGFIVESRSPEDLAPGEADLRIRASNTAEPPRSMESNTTFTVLGEETTTTTVTSTSTTTIESTTTTTQPVRETFCLTFSVTNAVDLVGISYNVGYGANGGDIVGSGEDVVCTTLLTANPEGELLASFNDQEVSHVLSTAIVSSDTFTGPLALARCEFLQVPPLVLSSFSIQVTEATSPDLSPTSATVAVEETPCP